jgi:putative ABC transport system substrate-binding protein
MSMPTAQRFSAKGATSTIPIIFLTAADPVLIGLVASLSRPNANMTGVASLAVELGLKQLELAPELVPTATTIALLVNPTSSTIAETLTRELRTAARTFGLQLHVLHASTKHATAIKDSVLGLYPVPEGQPRWAQVARRWRCGRTGSD